MTQLEITSTLTDRYQTTIPEAVRRALGLHKRDQLKYRVEEGQVIITRAQEERDPALAPFLALLQENIQRQPEQLKVLDGHLQATLQTLTADVEFDLDTPLDEE